jgi:hypothetical protein
MDGAETMLDYGTWSDRGLFRTTQEHHAEEETVTIERVWHRISLHNRFDDNEGVLIARYRVEGRDLPLEIRLWCDSDTANDAEKIGMLLEFCDIEAQRAADHPDQVPTYKPELVMIG